MCFVQFLLRAVLWALSSLSDHNGMEIAIDELLANTTNEHLMTAQDSKCLLHVMQFI